MKKLKRQKKKEVVEKIEKRIKKKRKRKGISCGYCQVFFDNVSQKREEKGTRECPISKDIVDIDFPACDDFIVSRQFYCSSFHYWLEPILCLKRKDRGMEKCQRCRQFDKEISYVIEEWMKENALKRKLRKETRLSSVFSIDQMRQPKRLKRARFAPKKIKKLKKRI